MRHLITTLALMLMSTSAFAAYKFSWYTDGTCGEQTPDGYHIQFVNRSYCENAVGFKYSWYSDGTCGEQTPDGYHVQYIDRSYCELL